MTGMREVEFKTFYMVGILVGFYNIYMSVAAIHQMSCHSNEGYWQDKVWPLNAVHN